jgi:hypothetical protein
MLQFDIINLRYRLFACSHNQYKRTTLLFRIATMFPKAKSPKRPLPTSQGLTWRQGFLTALQWIRPSQPTSPIPEGLAPGNKKTGDSGRFYRSVFVWNIPAVVSCPGASEWCLTHCYNADPRADIFPVSAWRDNWSWFTYKPQELRARILEQLSSAERPTAVRIHSSGDFYSQSYILFWIDVIRQCQDVQFWAYTRSWTIPDLLPHLELLRAEPNFELFASWDNTMPHPPNGWRLSLVEEKAEAFTKQPHDLLCPEQVGQVPNCASCGFCIERRAGNVLFLTH